jgi:phosphohistidine phosphatase
MVAGTDTSCKREVSTTGLYNMPVQGIMDDSAPATQVTPMKVYLAQHGKALASDIDPTRPLTGEGRTETQKVATRLAHIGIKVPVICHSGKLRAAQTAEIFADMLGCQEIIAIAGMQPNDDPAALNARAAGTGGLYVGHLPNLQRAASQMICDCGTGDVIQFVNSAVACIDISASTARLLWYITPELS